MEIVVGGREKKRQTSDDDRVLLNMCIPNTKLFYVPILARRILFFHVFAFHFRFFVAKPQRHQLENILFLCIFSLTFIVHELFWF